jgi:LuxR family transcriptional regulator, quorum-sensing system regulator SdiA
MMALLDYIEQITAAHTIEVVWQHHTKAMAEYGFDRLIYGFTRFRTANSLGNRDDVLILTNQTEEYMNEFVTEGLYFHAPMVRWAAENVGACSWRWISEHAASLTESEKKVIAFNLRMGVKAGYSISFHEASVRSKGAIALTARVEMTQAQVDAIWELHGRTILQMNNVVHQKITTLPFQLKKRNLTARQKETLEWVGDGKTTQDIATIMGLTPATVEKHLRLAREALDVETTAQAVLKASFQNQIFVLNA